jgi:ubiquinone/menaquinone biosynthesis C-methylase UbiE
MQLNHWQARFEQQANWTRDLRQYLYPRAELLDARSVLDVGCGTGALLGELTNQAHLVYGLDKDRAHLRLAASSKALLTCADAGQLPYPDHTFDATLCHFLLLWVDDPLRVVREMVRVTRPGGAVLALAEPDYGGRVDYPQELAVLGKLQSASLQQQGADPRIGRQVASIFQRAGLKSIETGVLGGQWATGQPPGDEWEAEWQVLEHDLKAMSEGVSASDIANWFMIERQARQRGERVLFVPTFWAWGKKGDNVRP